MLWIEKYIWLIFLIKIIFIGLALYELVLSAKAKRGEKSRELNDQIATVEFWKNRMEFIFIVSMSFLLIFMFFPWRDNTVFMSREARLLFYLFGFILLITADWSTFLHESPWWVTFQGVVGRGPR